METVIKDKLIEIEHVYKVKILYACETGSRAWGFPSPDSDYDVRMIYVHEPDWYLSLSKKKDSIEFMSENGELDITGWDIGKCLKLMLKSNGALLERVQSPIVYKDQNNIASELKGISEMCFSPIATIYHYYGMAKNSFSDLAGKESIKLKKLFYALRATLACKWILEKGNVPPIVFQTMVKELTFDKGMKVKIKDLIKLKSKQLESYMHPSEVGIISFIDRELDTVEMMAPGLLGRTKEKIDLDSFFRKIIKTY